MKKGINYGLALLVFVFTMLLMNGAGLLLSLGMSLFGVLSEGTAGVEIVYEYLMENLNLYSCLIYMIVGTVFLLWYYFAFVEPEGVNRFVNAQTRKLSPACFLWLIPLTFAVQHATSLIMALIAAAAPSAMESYTELVETSGLTQYSLIWFVATVILPPLVEETIFRGLILQYLKRAGACFIVANLMQAVLFGAFHMNLVQGIYAGALGFILGYLAWRYESLAAPVVMHALFNLFGTVLIDLENQFLPDFVMGLLVLASVPLLAIMLVIIHYGIGEKKKGNTQI